MNTTNANLAVAQPVVSKKSASSQDLLVRYMAEIRSYPPLSLEEEQTMTRQYRDTHDARIGARLITSNLRLVVKLAFGYRRSWTSLLDLIQEGNMGLAQALEKFDPLRGIRFTSYAQYWIRAYILQYIMHNVSLVSIGNTRAGRKLFYGLQKERTELMAQGIAPSPAVLAERLGVRQEEVERVSARLSNRDLSLDQPAGADRQGRPVAELIAADENFNPEKEVADGETGEQLREALNAFRATLEDEREAAIWASRMLTDTPVSLGELGEQFGLSKERIRQVEAKLRTRARAFLTDTHGEDVMVDLLGLPQRPAQVGAGDPLAAPSSSGLRSSPRPAPRSFQPSAFAPVRAHLQSFRPSEAVHGNA